MLNWHAASALLPQMPELHASDLGYCQLYTESSSLKCGSDDSAVYFQLVVLVSELMINGFVQYRASILESQADRVGHTSRFILGSFYCNEVRVHCMDVCWDIYLAVFCSPIYFIDHMKMSCHGDVLIYPKT